MWFSCKSPTFLSKRPKSMRNFEGSHQPKQMQGVWVVAYGTNSTGKKQKKATQHVQTCKCHFILWQRHFAMLIQEQECPTKRNRLTDFYLPFFLFLLTVRQMRKSRKSCWRRDIKDLCWSSVKLPIPALQHQLSGSNRSTEKKDCKSLCWFGFLPNCSTNVSILAATAEIISWMHS